MTDRQTEHRQRRPRLRTGVMPVLAGACVLALVAAIVAMAIMPTGSTLARFYSEASDDTEMTLQAQGIEAGTAGVVTPDYGSWNWFDRQMNETSLTLKNTSPTTMVASIRIASVELAGTNISEAWGKAAAFIVDDGGVKREISNYVTADTSTKQFSETELRWTWLPVPSSPYPCWSKDGTRDCSIRISLEPPGSASTSGSPSTGASTDSRTPRRPSSIPTALWDQSPATARPARPGQVPRRSASG